MEGLEVLEVVEGVKGAWLTCCTHSKVSEMDPIVTDLHLHKKVVHLHNGMQTWTFQKTFHYL